MVTHETGLVVKNQASHLPIFSLAMRSFDLRLMLDFALARENTSGSIFVVLCGF